MNEMTWPIFTGTGERSEPAPDIPDAPSWRTFDDPADAPDVPPAPERAPNLAPIHDELVLEMVSAAIALRRPLLVTGTPGCGKSVLASLVAAELSLGPVLRWPITSSSRLDKALYDYDAIGRVHEENRRRDQGDKAVSAIGEFIRLGPLGTALLPWKRPRVLLVDEIDKSDIDLPNDLLDVFELGEYRIDELARLPGTEPVSVLTADRHGRRDVSLGMVRCAQFPVVIMTSNDERSFPPAFMRRCLRLKLEQPPPEQLAAIVRTRIPQADDSSDLLSQFCKLVKTERKLATDQLLNAVFIASSRRLTGQDRLKLLDRLAQDLDQLAP